MVGWLDQANTYGIVQHGLFRFCLKCYDTPSKWLLPCPTCTLVGIVRTKNSDSLSPLTSKSASTWETPCQLSSLTQWHEDGVHPGGHHLPVTSPTLLLHHEIQPPVQPAPVCGYLVSGQWTSSLSCPSGVH